MHAEAATRDARRDADRRDEARETARRAPKLAAADAERLARASRAVATIRAVERRAVRDGSYLERDALGPALRDAGVFAAAPPSTRGAIRDEALAVYRLCACLGEGEGDVRAVPAWLFARFAGAVSRAETDRVCAIAKRRDATSFAFERSRGGSDLGREFDVGRRARESKTPWWPAGYSAEREASLAETFASVAGTAAANAKLSRTPIGRDRNDDDGRQTRAETTRAETTRAETTRAETTRAETTRSPTPRGKSSESRVRASTRFQRSGARVERTRVERTGVELAGVERAERSVATLAVVLAGVRVSPAAEPDATRAETRRGGSTRA